MCAIGWRYWVTRERPARGQEAKRRVFEETGRKLRGACISLLIRVFQAALIDRLMTFVFLDELLSLIRRCQTTSLKCSDLERFGKVGKVV